MTNLPQSPNYIKLPVSIASASVPDGLIVTMARILGLCWAQGYRESPAYAPDELAERLGRPRTTIYRHLKELQRLQWLEVRHHDRRLVLEPLVWASIRPRAGEPSPEGRGCDQPPRPEAPGEPGLRAALDEVGITGQVLRELVQQNVDPIQVRAWTLWTWAPERGWVRIKWAWVYSEHLQGWPSLHDNDKLYDIAPLWTRIHEAMRRARAR